MCYVNNLILCMIFIYPPLCLDERSFTQHILAIVLHLTALYSFFPPFHIVHIKGIYLLERFSIYNIESK